MVAGGDGLARCEGQVWFVPGLWPGETALVQEVSRKRGLVRGAVRELLEPSPERVEPFCSAADECGGCPWQGLGYSAQIRYKKEILRETWERMLPVWKDLPLDGSFSSEPRGGRNRIQLHREGRRLGMMAPGGDRLIPLDSCPAASPGINARWSELAEEIRTARNPEAYPKRIPLVGDERCAYAGGWENRAEWILAGKRVAMDPRGFFQSHLRGTEYLAQKLTNYLSASDHPRKRLYDLYGGVGLWGALLEDYAEEMIGVERDERTASLARENWGSRGTVYPEEMGQWLRRKGTGARGRAVKPGDAKGDPRGMGDEGSLVLADPPRKGFSRPLRDQLRRTPPPELIYISCQPVTQARDLAELQDIYRPVLTLLMDFYPNTAHMETAVILVRRES